MRIKNRTANNSARERSGFGRPDGRCESFLTVLTRCGTRGKFSSMPNPRVLILKMGLLLYPAKIASYPPKFMLCLPSWAIVPGRGQQWTDSLPLTR